MNGRNMMGFGGGCHWCTEAVFQSLRGISSVEQGFIASVAPHDELSEAVRVTFDPRAIPMRALVAAHLATHASTSAHSMRGKYRSAIYVSDKAEAAMAQDILTDIQPHFADPIITKVLPLISFKVSDVQFQDYYASDPQRPFCQTYIDPKLAKLRRQFADYYQDPSG